ncbi:MAG: hypothetical protein R3348_09195 [Xanthomonadales bacterium]|nr:hypothetical protein [Xanthomonadales bacterium]
MNRYLKGRAASLFAALVLASCASAPRAPEQPESIEERAVARWNHLIAGEFEQAYSYLSPGYRTSVSLDTYRESLSKRKLDWTGARFIGSECDDARCQVRILLDYRVVGAVPGVRTYTGKSISQENWVLVDESWWHVPSK